MLPASLLAPTVEASKFSLRCLNLLFPSTHRGRGASPSHDSLRHTFYWCRGTVSGGGRYRPSWERYNRKPPSVAGHKMHYGTPPTVSPVWTGENAPTLPTTAHPLLVPSKDVGAFISNPPGDTAEGRSFLSPITGKTVGCREDSPG